ncbi:hypothetical protein EJB05_38401, partial [Eragrostis curvula]
MELLSNTSVHHAVLDEYIMPSEKRPGNDELVDPTVTLPVIDLATGRHLVVDEIIEAGKEFGFFQARTKPFRLDTSTAYVDGDRSPRYWRDYLQLLCFPVDRFAPDWPAKPDAFRRSLAAYAGAVQQLAATVLGLVSERLGLDESFFRGELSGGGTLMNVDGGETVEAGCLPRFPRQKRQV